MLSLQTVILGFWALAHTQSWERVRSPPQQHQLFCGSRRISSPGEAGIRFLRDFCELEIEGQQGLRARTRAGLLIWKNEALQAKRLLGVYGCKYGSKAVSASAAIACLLLMGQGRECGVRVCQLLSLHCISKNPKCT